VNEEHRRIVDKKYDTGKPCTVIMTRSTKWCKGIKKWTIGGQQEEAAEGEVVTRNWLFVN